MVKEIPLNITVLYMAVTLGNNIDTYAQRFCRTYQDYPAGHPHKLVVVCNGGQLTERRKTYFQGSNCHFWEHENHHGFDIGAYVDYAKSEASKDEFLVCFGESVYFHRQGWLRRLSEERVAHGEGMYGCFSSHMVRAHLNTTAFATDARLLAQSKRVLNNEARYSFEHGYECYWKRVFAGGHVAGFVTWDGIFSPGEWRNPINILHRGDQSNLLVWANHSERWEQADPNTKKMWSQQSDSPFRV